MQRVTKDDDLVEKDELGEVDGSLPSLLLGDGVKELLLSIFEVEVEQVLWSFNQVVDLVVSSILDDQPVVEVEVIVETEDIHGAVVNQISFVAFIVLLVIIFSIDVVPVLVEPGIGTLSLVVLAIHRFTLVEDLASRIAFAV